MLQKNPRAQPGPPTPGQDQGGRRVAQTEGFVRAQGGSDRTGGGWVGGEGSMVTGSTPLESAPSQLNPGSAS